MSNSNVMAIGEDYDYEADQYEKYGMDMANDNYYKSKGSDFIKKINCNNINSNFNGVEANIGTGDPLGVGAESIQDDASANWFGNGQANNGNFDLDCINNNNNNNEGGQSEVPLRFYSVDGPTGNSLTGNTVADSTARCDEEDIATGGGYSLTPASSPVTVTTLPEEETNSNGWRAIATAPTDTTEIRISAKAQCLDNPPFRTLATADIATFQQQSEDSSIISQGKGDLPGLTTFEKQPDNSPIMTQAIENSPELTTTEKVTKLKTQWLDLLP